MKKGFTLVELSIALVIIGLLVGGILVAQGLIDSAKINSTASQIQQYDAAVSLFQSKFRDLPGDAPSFGGNGDGVIAANGNLACTIFSSEIARFWSSLQPNDYVAGNSGFGSKIVTEGSERNVPTSKLGKSESIIIVTAMTSDGDHADLSNPRNFYQILDGSSGQEPDAFGGFYGLRGTTSETAAVKPVNLLSLDQKIDDGIANQGDVLSGRVTLLFGGDYGGMTLPGLATCSNGADYQLGNDSHECTPLIRLGAQVGDPK